MASEGEPAKMRDRIDALEGPLEHRVRLAICVLLSRHDRLSFSRLKELTEATDGNLGAHLRRLEDEDYLRVEKTFRDRKPVTWYALAPAGRDALMRHLDVMRSLLHEAESG